VVDPLPPELREAMNLIDLIREHANESAIAGDFAAVASTLNDLTRTYRVGKVGGKESLQAIVATGEDPNQVIGTMRAVPMASVLLDTLISSGVDWADPVTDLIMSGLVSKGLIKQSVADAVRSLSERIEPVFAEPVTAEQCKAEWQSHISEQARNTLREAVAQRSAAVTQHINESAEVPTLSDVLAMLGAK
jgi:hypothetical protein